jgi:hypothetical protein
VPPPEAVRAAGEGLNYRDFLVVALILDQEDLFPDNWIYVHTPGVKVGRIQNFNNWSRAMVPDEGRTCLGMEYFCFEGDDLWRAATRRAHRAGGLRLAGAGGAGPGAAAVQNMVEGRHRGADAEGVPGLRRRLSGAPRRGPRVHRPDPEPAHRRRNGMHKYNNQDHSMLTAMMAVGTCRARQHDVWAVNSDFEYHEEQC